MDERNSYEVRFLARWARYALLACLVSFAIGATTPTDAQTPGASAVEDTQVGSRVLERQRRAYEAFQRRQSESYEAFQEERSAEYEAFVERMHSQYARFMGIVEEVESNERAHLEQRWEDPELSSQKVWVEYSEDLSERSRVDFETGTLTIERLEPASSEDTKAALRERVRRIVTRDRAAAFEDDRVAQEIERLGLETIEDLETAPVKATPILWPYLTGELEIDESEVDVVVDLLLARAVTVETMVGGERMQQTQIPLDTQTLLAQLDRLQSGEFSAQMPEVMQEPLIPPRSLPRPAPAPEAPPKAAPREPRYAAPETPKPSPKSPVPSPSPSPVPSQADRLPPRARPFQEPVDEFGGSRGLERSLVFAIIETESAFNPLARSPAPAYGLMQIVPSSAGLDATQVLFGRSRILAPSYLYDSSRNIEVGAVYLEILLGRYLKGIRDPQSRLYCAIAAYNTGAGNVFRAFTGQTRPTAAFAKINAMTPKDVYRHLIWNLPYEETRNYLAKVVERMKKYESSADVAINLYDEARRPLN